MLDNLPTYVRDFLFVVVPVVLGWLATSVVPALSHDNPLVGVGLAALVAALTAWLTPVTRAYGVGAIPAPPRATDGS